MTTLILGLNRYHITDQAAIFPFGSGRFSGYPRVVDQVPSWRLTVLRAKAKAEWMEVLISFTFLPNDMVSWQSCNGEWSAGMSGEPSFTDWKGDDAASLHHLDLSFYSLMRSTISPHHKTRGWRHMPSFFSLSKTLFVVLGSFLLSNADSMEKKNGAFRDTEDAGIFRKIGCTASLSSEAHKP